MTPLVIREFRADEHAALGRLMVEVYAQLQGFPKPAEQPDYYEKLANIGRLHDPPRVQVLVALADGALVGGIVYVADMAAYGSGGTASSIADASGIRLLGVSPQARGLGAGKALTMACIQRARDAGHAQVVLHSTQAMQVAWAMYERLGFARSTDLDFAQGALPVYGFRLALLEPLFSYGTLQLESVQLSTFGRRLRGEPDQLVGFRLDRLAIDDAAVVATSGASSHPIVRATGDAADRVPGVVFELSAAELAQADAYEVDDYERIRVRLVSGRSAWVYAAAAARA